MFDESTENHDNPTTYFFYDDTQVELTVKEAAYFLTKFNELSEEHKDVFISTLGETSTFVTDFIEL